MNNFKISKHLNNAVQIKAVYIRYVLPICSLSFADTSDNNKKYQPDQTENLINDFEIQSTIIPRAPPKKLYLG